MIKTTKRFFFCVAFVCGMKHSFCQVDKADSLKNIIAQAKHDTTEVKALIKLSWNLLSIGNYNTALELANEAKNIAEKLNFKKGIANSYNNIGTIYWYQGNYFHSIKQYSASLKIFEEIGNKQGIADCYNNIGLIYNMQGNYSESLKQFFVALRIYKEIENKQGIAWVHGNIGEIYNVQGNYSVALKQFFEALRIFEELGDKNSIGTTYNNIGNVYKKQGDYFEALKQYFIALKIAQQIGDKKGMAISFKNIGTSYMDLKNYKEAQAYSTKALNSAKEIGHLETVKEANQTLSDIYIKIGRPIEALVSYKAYISARDSLVNKENTKKIVQTQMQYEFDKKQTADSLKVAEERKVNTIKFEQEKTQRYYLYGGLVLVIVFAGFMFNRFNVTRKQKLIIEKKQKEITDSITYAKRLQTAILPPETYWKNHLPESFVLYQPKDIVSGDFYWLENVNNLVLFAAADCTGHGVSGAMVSVVCSNALTRTVKEFGITEPDKILNKVRELVLETFAKSESDIKDGMDISLCCLNIKTNELFWSGANNPLWYIRENNLNEIKGDKQPIGKNDNPKPFISHTIQLQKQDTIYIFTDGYADQFGGEKNKKLMYKPLKNLLLEIHQQSLAEQKEILQQHFANWKGNIEQTDDVLIIGVKV